LKKLAKGGKGGGEAEAAGYGGAVLQRPVVEVP
jgi:hypothetical protein